MYEIDDSFKRAKQQRQQKKRQRQMRRIWGGLAALLVVGTATSLVLYAPVIRPPDSPGSGDPAPELAVDDAEPAVFIPAIVDLAGDPMRISLGDDVTQAQRVRLVPRPDGVPADRAGGEVAVLSDVMISSSQRFMTTLPSSPSDFAFYQSQRQQLTATPVVFTEPAPLVENAEPVDITSGGAGWGEDLAEPADAVDIVERTSLENTTSVATVRRETDRFRPDGDIRLRVLVQKSVPELLAENGLTHEGDADAFAQALKSLLGRDALLPGDVVAFRTIKASAAAAPQVMQMSIYTSAAYIGTLAAGADAVTLGADPWVFDDLFNYQGEESVAEPGRQYRLLDAVYSTAVRNRVPTGILGEAIMMLSRRYDLNAFASTSDRLVLAFNQQEGSEETFGHVLYAAIEGPDRDMPCFVFRASIEEDFSCFTEEQGVVTSAPAPGGGLTTPVKGVLTSKFGPRKHPIFKDVRVHTGVDWAAPSGTPVAAAFAGTIAYAGSGGGYGNLLKIAHDGGRETWYAHLSAFGEGIAAGRAVNAGDLVGYVGTTGNSTGPHLHFELRVSGAPTDPLQAPPVAVAAASTGMAVEALTEQIVRVESGGNATAKNPLSSATGAGQFIQSTWLRMMRTYRPDLSNSMSSAELLELRNDPTISREMVQNLAREGEAYLKARGHSITAGRLYLAHFLGMEGAARVLSADPALSLETLLGASVINANPFLRGHDVAYVIAWAERKMAGVVPNTQVQAPAPVAVPPQNNREFELYKAAILAMLEEDTVIPDQELAPPTTS